MCRLPLILIFSILPIVCFGQDAGSSASSELRTPQDSTALAVLDIKVDEYLSALETQTTEVKCTEADFIIASCTDSSVLTRVANRVYKHYFSSKLMGDEAVAIHIFDTWFADRAVKMESEDEFYAATFFAAVNRNSLLGMQAPQLRLYDPENEEVTIFGDRDSETSGIQTGELSTYNVLFFYDVGCPTCMAETVALLKILEGYSGKLRLYAVYIGSDADKWAEYRERRFNGAGIVHLWDPEATSNISFDYGVVGTPRLFLISPDGTIIGRGLDSVALGEFLEIILGVKTLEYGSQESMDLYDRTFEGYESCANVSEVAAHIEEMLLPRGDTLLFKQMTGDLLYFLTSRREARFKCATEEFINGFIVNRPDIWTTADDSLQVVSLGSFVKDLLSLCPVGEKLPPIKVPVEVLTRRKSKSTTLRLDKQKNCAIMFYTDGCGLCAEDLKAAMEILKTGTVIPNTDITPSKIVLIDMDGIWSAGGELPDKLMMNFDLSTLPFIICLDGQGLTAYKYVDFN